MVHDTLTAAIADLDAMVADLAALGPVATIEPEHMRELRAAVLQMVREEIGATNDTAIVTAHNAAGIPMGHCFPSRTRRRVPSSQALLADAMTIIQVARRAYELGRQSRVDGA